MIVDLISLRVHAKNMKTSAKFGLFRQAFNLSILAAAFVFIFYSKADAQWQKQTVNTKASLRGLSVVNEKVVGASGTGGSFLRSVDGGKTWTVGTVAGAEKLDFRDVEAFDETTAY